MDAVKQHYNERADRGLKRRRESPILALRNLNNWIKSVLIDEFLVVTNRKDAAVLDLCGGKGGDLTKFAKLGVGRVLLADVAEQSVKDAQKRFKDATLRGNFNPIVDFMACDCHLPMTFGPAVKFNLVSCQFALHYSFATEERAKGLLSNAAARLVHGGYLIGTLVDSRVVKQRLAEAKHTEFGNSVYRVCMTAVPVSDEKASKTTFGKEYRFTLVDAVTDCPEFLVDFDALVGLAKSIGFELALFANFADYVAMRSDPVKFPAWAELLKRTMAGASLSKDERQVASLYCVFAFRFLGQT